MVITQPELVSVLTAHWATYFAGDAKTKALAICNCGWKSDKEESLGAAVEAWARHVAGAI